MAYEAHRDDHGVPVRRRRWCVEAVVKAAVLEVLVRATVVEVGVGVGVKQEEVEKEEVEEEVVEVDELVEGR